MPEAARGRVDGREKRHEEEGGKGWRRRENKQITTELERSQRIVADDNEPKEQLTSVQTTTNHSLQIATALYNLVMLSQNPATMALALQLAYLDT